METCKVKWNEIFFNPPFGKDILVYDKSCSKIRIMSCRVEDPYFAIVNWFDENGYYDDSEPEITHWMELPSRPE